MIIITQNRQNDHMRIIVAHEIITLFCKKLFCHLCLPLLYPFSQFLIGFQHISSQWGPIEGITLITRK